MCARVTSTYMEFTFTFGPKPEFKFSFKSKIPQNHSFFFKTLETNIRSCYTIQTELSSDIHHFLYRNEDFYL